MVEFKVPFVVLPEERRLVVAGQKTLRDVSSIDAIEDPRRTVTTLFGEGAR